MWTNAPECVLSEGNTREHLSATGLTFAVFGVAMASVLTMKEKGHLKSSVRGSRSTSHWKNIPEISVAYWYSGFTGFLKMGQSGLPAMFCSRRTRRHHLSQTAFSAWLSPETCKGISFCKTPWESKDEDTHSVLARHNSRNWVPYRDFTKKTGEKKKNQQIVQRPVIWSLTASFFQGRQNIFGVEDVPLPATGYQFQLYPHTPALREIYKLLHRETLGNNCIVPFQTTV